MPYYDARIHCRINAETILDAEDILEITLNNLQSVKDVVVTVDNKHESVSSTKVKT